MDIRELAKKGVLAELARLDQEREKMLALLAELDSWKGEDSNTVGATLAVALQEPVQVDQPLKRKRVMSAAGSQAIRDAVARRWAKVRETASEPKDSAAATVTKATLGVGQTAKRAARAANRAAARAARTAIVQPAAEPDLPPMPRLVKAKDVSGL